MKMPEPTHCSSANVATKSLGANRLSPAGKDPLQKTRLGGFGGRRNPQTKRPRAHAPKEMDPQRWPPPGWEGVKRVRGAARSVAEGNDDNNNNNNNNNKY